MNIDIDTPPSKKWILAYNVKYEKAWIHKTKKLAGSYVYISEKKEFEWRECHLIQSGFNISTIRYGLIERSIEALKENDISTALQYCRDGSLQIEFVKMNIEILRTNKILSEAIYRAWSNYHYGTDRDTLQYIINQFGTDNVKNITEQIPSHDKILKVYRGVSRVEFQNGFSWTLDQQKAEYFATRENGNGIIFCGSVNKDDIAFYTDARDEKEIVTVPQKVFNVQMLTI